MGQLHIGDFSSVDDLDQAVAQAQAELTQLLELFHGKQLVPTRLDFSSRAEQLTGFATRYQARLVSGRITSSQAELRKHVTVDIHDLLSELVMLQDELLLEKPATISAIDTAQLDSKLSYYTHVLAIVRQRFEKTIEDVEGARILDGNVPLLTIADQGARELERLILRVVPLSELLDRDLTEVFESLLRGAVQDQSYSFSENRLDYYQRCEIGRSQEYREQSGPFWALLLSALFHHAPLYVHDDIFRNAYFTTVNFLQKYVRLHPESQAKPASSQVISLPTTKAEVNQEVDSPNNDFGIVSTTASRSTPSQFDTSSNSTPMPPFDEPEPATITPLLSDADVEAITHEALDSLDDSTGTKKSPTKVIGTGLE